MTVDAATIALVAVLTTGLFSTVGLLATALFRQNGKFDRLRAEMGQLHGEMGQLHGEMGGLRGEFGEFRGEVRAEFTELRGEVREIRTVLEAHLAEHGHTV